jgi:hypothetical protein
MSKASNYSFKLELILEVKLVLVENLQTYQIQFQVFSITLNSLESELEHRIRGRTHGTKR